MRAQLLQVVARAESLAVRGQHDDASVFVGGKPVELGLERREHVARQRVEPVAAIQRQHRARRRAQRRAPNGASSGVAGAFIRWLPPT
jgi:hypothetical protein